MRILVISLLFFLFGCDINEKYTELTKDIPKPDIVLGKGIEFEISEGQIAKVYGPDICPTDDVLGCTLLSGRDSVEVTLISEGGMPFKEVWTINHGVGPNGKGISIARPNGWLIREQLINNRNK